jgi:hypothetical protein
VAQRVRGVQVLHDAEVHHLRHVRRPAALAQDHVRGLDVAVHERDTVGLAERCQRLP